MYADKWGPQAFSHARTRNARARVEGSHPCLREPALPERLDWQVAEQGASMS